MANDNVSVNDKQKSILDQASFAEGGMSFISDVSKMNVLSQPILVVGLGGTGIDALLHVKKKVNEIFITGKDEATGKRKTAPDNIKFLAIDTDETYFVDHSTGQKGRTYLGMNVEEDEELNIGSTKVTAYIENAFASNYEFVTSWFNRSIGVTGKDFSKGAGGIRQISRLLVFMNYAKIRSKIMSDVRELYKRLDPSDSEAKLMVFVVGGISGGTGSGTFLDIPYIIQDCLREVLGKPKGENVWDRLMMNAYFATPDVSLQNFKSDYIEVNGYSALKELDYLMGIAERGEIFEQQYSTSPMDVIKTSAAPYSLVNFVSATHDDGTPIRDPYDTALLTIAENIIYFIENDSKSSFGAMSFMVNYEHDLEGTINKMEIANTIKPVGYRYGIIGSAGKILPVQDIMTCLASRLLDEVNNMWQAHGEPTNEEVSYIVGPNCFAIDRQSLTNIIKQGIALDFTKIKADPASYPASSKANLTKKGSTTSATPDFENMLKMMESIVNTNSNSKDVIDGIYQKIEDKLQGFFENSVPVIFPDPMNPNAAPTYGPIFANNVLVGVHGGTNLNCLSFCFQEMTKLQSEINALSQTIPNKITAANNSLQEAKKSLMSSGKYYDQYMNQMIDLYNCKLNLTVAKCLYNIYNKINEKIYEMNHEVYGVIFSTLTTLREIFAQNMEVMGDVAQRRTVEGSVMEWYVVSLTDVNETISKILQENNIELPVGPLYKEIWSKRKNWSTTDVKDYTVFEDLTNFIGTQFQNVLGVSLEVFLEDEFKRSGKAGSFQDYLQYSLDSTLMTESRPLFKLTDTFVTEAGGIESIPGRIFIQVPSNCTMLLSILQGKYANDTRVSVVPSDNKSRIVYNNMIYGVPIYAYSMAQELEQKYEASINNSVGFGAHLLQSSDPKKNWMNVSAVVHPDSRTHGYSNLREDERMKRALAIFDEAVKYGVIKSANGVNVEAVFSGDLDVDAIVGSTGGHPVKISNAIAELKSYIGPEKDLPGDQELYKNPDGKVTTVLKGSTIEKARYWFTATHEITYRIEAEIAKYKKIEEALKKLQDSFAEFDNYNVMVRAYLTNTITKNGPKYLYNPSFQEEAIEIAKRPELENAEFEELSLYKALFVNNKLLASHFELFKKDIAARFEEFINTDDYDTNYYPPINAMKADVNAKLIKIEANASLLANAEELNVFYNVIKAYLESL